MGFGSSSSKTKSHKSTTSSNGQLNEVGMIPLVRDASIYSGKTVASQLSSQTGKTTDTSSLISYDASLRSSRYAPSIASVPGSLFSIPEVDSNPCWTGDIPALTSGNMPNDQQSLYSTTSTSTSIAQSQRTIPGSIASSQASSMGNQQHAGGYIPATRSAPSISEKSTSTTTRSRTHSSSNRPSVKSQSSESVNLFDQGLIEARFDKQKQQASAPKVPEKPLTLIERIKRDYPPDPADYLYNEDSELEFSDDEYENYILRPVYIPYFKKSHSARKEMMKAFQSIKTSCGSYPVYLRIKKTPRNVAYSQERQKLVRRRLLYKEKATFKDYPPIEEMTFSYRPKKEEIDTGKWVYRPFTTVTSHRYKKREIWKVFVNPQLDYHTRYARMRRSKLYPFVVAKEKARDLALEKRRPIMIGTIMCGILCFFFRIITG